MAFCSIVKICLDSEHLFINLDFDTSTTEVRLKLLEIQMIPRTREILGDRFWKRQIVANEHILALGHSVIILSHS